MNRSPKCAKGLVPLIASLLVLPVAIMVVLGVGELLAAMGDLPAGRVLRYIALALGILWTVGLIALVLVQAFCAINGRPDDPA